MAVLGLDLPPVTIAGAFLHASLDEAVAAFVAWQGPLLQRRDIELAVERRAAPTLNGLVCGAFPALVTVERTGYLFVECRDRTGVAVLDNGANGPDPASLAAILTGRIGSGRAVTATFVDDDPVAPVFGASMLEVFDVRSGHPSNSLRSIAAVNDGGSWTFDESGDRLEFEHGERYGARRIRDRLPRELLEEYLQALEAPLFDPSAFDPMSAIVVRKRGALPARVRALSLDACRPGG